MNIKGLITIDDLLKSVNAYMQMRIELIYLNENVVGAYADLEKVIIQTLDKRNVVLNDAEKMLLIEEINNGMLDLLDSIIVHTYKSGFGDAMMIQNSLKELK